MPGSGYRKHLLTWLGASRPPGPRSQPWTWQSTLRCGPSPGWKGEQPCCPDNGAPPQPACSQACDSYFPGHLCLPSRSSGLWGAEQVFVGDPLRSQLPAGWGSTLLGFNPVPAALARGVTGSPAPGPPGFTFAAASKFLLKKDGASRPRAGVQPPLCPCGRVRRAARARCGRGCT